MSVPPMTLDVMVALLMLALAVRVLFAEGLYQTTILFIAFGLTMALAWTRLAAPDVALAEAAIGTGLLGALMLDSLRVFSRDGTPGQEERAAEAMATAARLVRGVLGVLSAGIGVVLVVAVLDLPERAGLTEAAAERMAQSGVEHPVTAVLLNFRGFDTFLEVGVLILTMWGIICAGGVRPERMGGRVPAASPLLAETTRILFPVYMLVAAYLLWLGKMEPGGAFQAGVVLGAGLILLHVAGHPVIPRFGGGVQRAGLLLGFTVFLAAGLALLFAGRSFLEYPAAQAGIWILLLETAAAVSIGFTLAFFFEYLSLAETGDGGEGKGGADG